MNEFFEENQNKENEQESISAEPEENTGEQYNSVYNPINFSPVEPVPDTKPANKGLKIFALVVAVALVLTAACSAGYFWGRSGSKTLYKQPAEMDLASRPENTDEMTAAQVYDSVNQSIVGIVIYDIAGQGSQASGIIYSNDGYIITNDHIYSEIPSAKFKVYTHDGKEYDAKFVAGDSISDLAVLKIDGVKDLTPAKFGNSDELYHGQNVVAVGRPTDATSPSSITTGIVSAVSRRLRTASNYSARLIQTDCAINPGSSGGALVDMYGHVVGVTSSKLVSTAYDNVGYAIPTTVTKRIVEELISEGKVVSRAKLGITYTMIDTLAAELKGYDHIGLYIATVAEDSGLYGKAFEGDIITHINDIPVTNDTVVLDIIENSRAGDKITVTIVTTNGQNKTVTAQLKANLSESSYKTSSELIDEGSSDGKGTFDFPEGE